MTPEIQHDETLLKLLGKSSFQLFDVCPATDYLKKPNEFHDAANNLSNITSSYISHLMNEFNNVYGYKHIVGGKFNTGGEPNRENDIDKALLGRMNLSSLELNMIEPNILHYNFLNTSNERLYKHYNKLSGITGLFPIIFNYSFSLCLESDFIFVKSECKNIEKNIYEYLNKRTDGSKDVHEDQLKLLEASCLKFCDDYPNVADYMKTPYEFYNRTKKILSDIQLSTLDFMLEYKNVYGDNHLMFEEFNKPQNQPQQNNCAIQ